MKKQVEFYFDVGSPTAYLAWKQLPNICAQQEAELVLKPILLGGVFKATGNAAPMMVPAKGKWLQTDIHRFAKRYGVALNFNPHFPINTLPLMRAIVAVQAYQPEQLTAFVDTLFQAIWVDKENMGDAVVIGRVLTAAGFDAEALQEQTQDAAIKDKLKTLTSEAVERGAFGAPTMFVGDDMFFGQDRLDFVEEVLQGQ